MFLVRVLGNLSKLSSTNLSGRRRRLSPRASPFPRELSAGRARVAAAPPMSPPDAERLGGPPWTRFISAGARPAHVSSSAPRTGSPRSSARGRRMAESRAMDHSFCDVLIVGGGGAGLRAAIAVGRDVSRAQRRRDLQGVSHAQPHGLGRGGRGRRHQAGRQPGRARLRHHLRRRLAQRSGRGRGVRAGGARRR